MQDVHDPRAFTIVERFENESVRSRSSHLIMGTDNLSFHRARNITLRIPTGRPLILMSYPSSTRRWTCVVTKS